LVLEVLVV
jgi:hypothetical protein